MTTITFTEEDILRMRGIVLDNDSVDGIALVKELLKRI